MRSSPDRIMAEGQMLLRELLEIPSPSGQEQAAVEHLVCWMARRGFTAHQDGAGNACGWLEARGRVYRELILLGHIDTVAGFPRVMEHDGRLYGRGAVDAKGPLAAFVTAAAMAGPQPGWRIIVVGAVEEETASSKGARYLAAHRRPDLAVIGEPTGWQRVALGYKGRLQARVRFCRSLSHTAGPDTRAAELAFAFWQQAQAALSELNASRETSWERVQASLLGFASWDDGLQETAELQLGFRLPADISPETLKQLLVTLNGEGTWHFRGAERAYLAPKNTPLVRAFLAAVRAHAGTPGFLLKTGTCDMNVVGPAWNCPILAYGPGDSRLDHTPDEHIEIAEWQQSTAVLADAIRRLTSTPFQTSS